MLPTRRRFRLRTERLTIRMLARRDIADFTRYRNLADVARFQDWPLPYTRGLAHELVDEMDGRDGPVRGAWVQLAIESADGLVGDAAVWLDDEGLLAMIGYTLAPEHQGRGYAVEAIAALVDDLFDRWGVHRIAATLDPRNAASARVLERTGFRYVGTARSAALIRGEWTDDARYSLLPDEWRAWRDRPTATPRVVELVAITTGNVRAVAEIQVAHSLEAFVPPVLVSLTEALVAPTEPGASNHPWSRAIVADGEVVGLVMVAEPDHGSAHPVLLRLVIDHRHQRRGIGRRAAQALVAARRAGGDSDLLVRFGPGAPERFYRSLGFEPTGERSEGDPLARLDLTAPLPPARR